MWTTRWIQSHKNDLNIRKSKYLTNKRIDEAIYDEIVGFIVCVEQQLSKTKFPDCAIINYDETRICAGKSGNFVIENNKKERSNTLGVRASTLATLLIFIAADGSVVCDFIIVKGKIEKRNRKFNC